jgi:hypothetical protein
MPVDAGGRSARLRGRALQCWPIGGLSAVTQPVFSDHMTFPDPSVLLGGAGRKRNLYSHVVQALGIRIVRGELGAGEPFPSEAELGREFGASRSVIREAVKSLAARGLLESRTRTGIRVLPSMHWNLLDVDVLTWRYEAMPRASSSGVVRDSRHDRAGRRRACRRARHQGGNPPHRGRVCGHGAGRSRNQRRHRSRPSAPSSRRR